MFTAIVLILSTLCSVLQLWPLFGGRVTKPNKRKLFYIPQVLSLLCPRCPVFRAYLCGVNVHVHRLYVIEAQTSQKSERLVGIQSCALSDRQHKQWKSPPVSIITNLNVVLVAVYPIAETIHDDWYSARSDHLPG